MTKMEQLFSNNLQILLNSQEDESNSDSGSGGAGDFGDMFPFGGGGK
ncbi:hypothetical protein [Paenibacillus piri]|nr:hypothetical protein [Paenibacillus piri]